MSTTLLTEVDVAERLQLSREQVIRRARSGEFPSVKIGRSYRFTEAQFAAIVATHSVEARVTPENPWGVRRRKSA